MGGRSMTVGLGDLIPRGMRLLRVNGLELRVGSAGVWG